MNADWKQLTREAGLKVSSEGFIRVACGPERTHMVFVEPRSGVFRLWSRVVPRRHTPNGYELMVWRMNRFREIAGFKVTDRGHVIGEAWIPDIAITPEEWKIAVQTLARACDRLEYLWSGKDVE